MQRKDKIVGLVEIVLVEIVGDLKEKEEIQTIVNYYRNIT